MRTLLEDVENVRRAKMYEGMGSAAQEVQQAVKVRKTAVPCILQILRPFLPADSNASFFRFSEGTFVGHSVRGELGRPGWAGGIVCARRVLYTAFSCLFCLDIGCCRCTSWIITAGM